MPPLVIDEVKKLLEQGRSLDQIAEMMKASGWSWVDTARTFREANPRGLESFFWAHNRSKLWKTVPVPALLFILWALFFFPGFWGPPILGGTIYDPYQFFGLLAVLVSVIFFSVQFGIYPTLSKSKRYVGAMCIILVMALDYLNIYSRREYEDNLIKQVESYGVEAANFRKNGQYDQALVTSEKALLILPPKPEVLKAPVYLDMSMTYHLMRDIKSRTLYCQRAMELLAPYPKVKEGFIKNMGEKLVSGLCSDQ